LLALIFNGGKGGFMQTEAKKRRFHRRYHQK